MGQGGVRAAGPEERKKLHRLGDAPLIATFAGRDGDGLELATRQEHRATLLGPFAGRANRRSAEHATADVTA